MHNTEGVACPVPLAIGRFLVMTFFKRPHEQFEQENLVYI